MKLRGKIILFHCRYDRFRSSHHTNRTNQLEDDFADALKREHIGHGWDRSRPHFRGVSGRASSCTLDR